jgi:glycosyltransferase involved in cell wall biosynthesis
VLHVAQPTTEGVAVVAAALVRDQVARGWSVTVCCPDDGDLPGWAREAGAAHVSWPAGREPGPALAGELLRLARGIRDTRPDLVHLHSSKAGLAGRLVLRGRVPTVFSPHAWSFLAAAGPKRWAALRWERSATRWTSVVLAVSEAEVVAGEAAGVGARYVVARNGVDLDRIRPASDAERAAARESLGLDSTPLAVCVGRVCEQKGQDLLLSAWPDVRYALPEATCVLVGDGPGVDAVRAAATPGVVAVGRRRDVPAWLAAADVVVLPSRWEGMSLALLEAMAAGRAVVTTDVAGAAEALGGVTEPVPVGDVAALAAATTHLLSDRALAAAQGSALRRRAEELFDLDRTTADVAALYLELLDRR